MIKERDIFNLALSPGDRNRLEYLHSILKDSRAAILKRGLNTVYELELHRNISEFEKGK